MFDSHKLLTLCIATGCWLSAAFLREMPIAKLSQEDNPLAIRRSGYGSLAARLMKDSMHNYWHAGAAESVQLGTHAQEMRADLEPGVAVFPSKSWLQKTSQRISELETRRKESRNNVPIRHAHKRYLEATATRYLRVAYHLDPGDSALYEILHYTAMSEASSSEGAIQAAQALANETIAHALSSNAGCAAALTGAGAAINLLNNEMQAGAPVTVSVEQMRHHWEMLLACRERYRALRQGAVSEGWWAKIPVERQREITCYAALVDKLSGLIGRKFESVGELK